MHIGRYLFLVAALTWPASNFAAQAQGPVAADPATPSTSSERRLAADEVERILDEAAARREAAEAARPGSGPMLFGEVGFAIGTDGFRSTFGSIYLPMDDGFASFFFGTEDR